jgi:hypothetical protein
MDYWTATCKDLRGGGILQVLQVVTGVYRSLQVLQVRVQEAFLGLS